MRVKDWSQLDGRAARVTGGARGRGLQLAQALGALGCRLARTARQVAAFAAAQRQLVVDGGSSVG